MENACDKCKYESTISRVEKKLESIDEKLDRFLEKTTRVETQMAAVMTGFIVIGPICIGTIIYIIQNMRG